MNKKQYLLIILIIFLAYLLRILPYLLGYPIPITDDSLRDFQQVQFMIKNNAANFSHPYGSFPLLHLVVYLVSRLGFNPLRVFLFIPQIFPCIGILFFYLFLKKYFPEKHSLFACLLITFFGPHIYWSAQPVRETMGLFFFPLIVYLFDKEISNYKQAKIGIINKIFLIACFVLMILSHHWSTLMILGFLFFYLIFMTNNKKQLFYSLLLFIIFLILTLIYWYIAFPFILRLIIKLAKNLIFLLMGLIFLILFLLLIKRFNLNKIKTKLFMIITSLILILIIFLLTKLPVFIYPLQIWIMFLIYALLILIGFFSTKNKNINFFSKISLFYITFMIISIFYIIKGTSISNMPFDPIRIFEFIIFPCSILASYGLLKIKKIIIPFLIIFLLILGTLIYPPIFVYKNTFEGTIFYDIRSHIRHIPPEGFELIKYANEKEINIISNSPVISEFQNTFYSKKRHTTVLISEYDYKIQKMYNKVKIKKLGISNPRNLIKDSKKKFLFFSNSWGRLYKKSGYEIYQLNNNESIYAY